MVFREVFCKEDLKMLNLFISPRCLTKNLFPTLNKQEMIYHDKQLYNSKIKSLSIGQKYIFMDYYTLFIDF